MAETPTPRNPDAPPAGERIEIMSKCVRCGYVEAEHPENVTPAEALQIPEGQPCHRYERKAPLWLRVINR